MFYAVCSTEMSYVLYIVNLRANLRGFNSCSIHLFYTVCSTEMSYVLYIVNLSDKAISLINNLISALHSDYLHDVPSGALSTGGVPLRGEVI